MKILLSALDVLNKLHFILLAHYLKVYISCRVLRILTTFQLRIVLLQLPDFIDYFLIPGRDLLLASVVPLSLWLRL